MIQSDLTFDNKEDVSRILPKATGTELNYYHICRRKLWFFTHGLEMEQESDYVADGRVIHQQSYAENKKEIAIDNKIVIDVVQDRNTLIEIKRSKAMSKAHEIQLKYYLYYLRLKGIGSLSGIISYPLLKKKVAIELTDNDANEIEYALEEIEKIRRSKTPPPLSKMRICKKCSYYELCFS